MDSYKKRPLSTVWKSKNYVKSVLVQHIEIESWNFRAFWDSKYAKSDFTKILNGRKIFKIPHCVVLPFPILILWRRVGLFSLLRDFILAPSTLDSEHVKKYDLIMERRNGDCLFRDRRLDLHYMQILTEFVFSFSGKVPGSVSLHKKLSLWSPPFLSMYEID